MLIFGRFTTFLRPQTIIFSFPEFFFIFKIRLLQLQRNMGTYKFKRYIFLGIMTPSPVRTRCRCYNFCSSLLLIAMLRPSISPSQNLLKQGGSSSVQSSLRRVQSTLSTNHGLHQTLVFPTQEVINQNTKHPCTGLQGIETALYLFLLNC